MNALVYILYNKKLKGRHLKLKSLANEEDSLLIDELSSEDERLGEPSQATQPIASLSKNASASASKGKEKLRLIDEDEDEWEYIDYHGGSGNKDDEAREYNEFSDEVSL
nr:HAT, C-terminal dimerization domain containing protein [Ipomoea batatas]